MTFLWGNDGQAVSDRSQLEAVTLPSLKSVCDYMHLDKGSIANMFFLDNASHLLFFCCFSYSRQILKFAKDLRFHLSCLNLHLPLKYQSQGGYRR